MAIDIQKYVSITSGVGGGAGVKTRELIGRFVTQNVLLPAGTFVEFTTLPDVGTFFGTSSEEYLRASAYFSFISKNIVKPSKISFVRWNVAAAAPTVLSDASVKNLTAIKALSAGNIKIATTLGGAPIAIGPINFSGAADLTACATLLQTAVRLGADAQLTTATVTYNTTTQRFSITGTVAGSGQLTVSAGATSDASLLLGYGKDQVSVAGMAAQTAMDSISQSAQASDNFGSFAYLPVLTAPELLTVAQWTHAQNNKFIFSHKVLSSATSTIFDTLKGFSGVGVTLYDPNTPNYPEQCPMEILAATDYTKRNASQNYMFYQFGARNALVTDTTVSNTLDAARVNYMGQTQTAGQKLEFYQRGTLMGDSTAATDMNTFANEIWFKDFIITQVMSLFLSLGRVPANESGRGLVLSTLQTCIDAATFNGVISIGKELNNTQKAYIGQITGDLQAWFQVQSIGYWFDVEMVQFTTDDGRTEWRADYQLIYAKDDAVRKVVGSNILI